MSRVFGIIIEEDLCLSDILGRSKRDFLFGCFVKVVSVSDDEDEVEDALDNGGDSCSKDAGMSEVISAERWCDALEGTGFDIVLDTQTPRWLLPSLLQECGMRCF